MSNLTIAIIISEVLFLCLVIAFVWILILRHRLQQCQAELIATKPKLDNANLKIVELERWLSAAQNARKSKASKSDEVSHKEVLQLKERIKNLEKFKVLYFKSEENSNKRVSSQTGNSEIEQSVGEQGKIITSLKENLEKATKENKHLDYLSGDLFASVLRLETLNNELEKKLTHTKRQRAMAEKEVEELTHFRDQVTDLEQRQSRLQGKLSDKEDEISSLKWERPKQNFGAVRIKEIEDLSGRLHARDAEVKRLRQECETIGKQYEDLAAKSLALASSNDDLSDEKKEELEQLKNKLEKNSEELALKQAECEMLEGYYLQLENGEVESDKVNYLDSLVAKDELQNERDSLYQLVSPIIDDDSAQELLELKEGLSERATELEKVKQDYLDIKQQFIEVAHEEIALRTENHELKTTCEQLKAKVLEMEEFQKNAREQAQELESIRDEYNKLESRYLSLVENY